MPPALRPLCLLLASVVALPMLTACEDPETRVTSNPVIVPGRPGEAATTLPPGSELPASEDPVTEADVAFVVGMIPHHEQALLMADLAPGRAQHEHVKGLAARISDVQTAEIDVLGAWLEEHGLGLDGRPADRRGGSHDAHGDPEDAAAHHDGMGMASEADLRRLEAASGPEFDRLWLELMIAHHEGAIGMVRQREDDGGANLRVDELAAGVAADQAAEIRRMEALLAGLG